MVTLNIPLVQLQIVFLIFIRVISIIFVAPVFEARNIPILFKVGLAMTISFLLYPIIQLEPISFETSLIIFVIRLFREIALGVLIGFSIKFVFAGIQLAGQIAGFQMGFSIANVMDPLSSMQIPILAQINYLVAVLIFLALNAHHWFLKALVESFYLLPPFNFQFNSLIIKPVIGFAGDMFVIAIKVGGPVIAVMLLTSVALGLIAKTVPQIQILIVAMPLKIMIGLIFLCLSLPYIAAYLKILFFDCGKDIFLLLRLLS